MAKSTIMMPFFFTMPISRMMPISATRLKSKWNSISVASAPTPAEGKRREDGQRVDVALVENAEDQIDDEQRGQDQHRHGRQRILERLGVALEGRDDASPACCNSRLACSMASRRLPSATPCARLKLMVIAGNWP